MRWPSLAASRRHGCCTVGDLFNHPSNIPTDTPLLALDLSALLRASDEELERLSPVIVMDFFVTVAINRPTGRRAHLVLDETHALLHSEAGARTLQMIFRIGRISEQGAHQQLIRSGGIYSRLHQAQFGN